MTRVIQVTKVQETALWKNLPEREGEVASSLSTNVKCLCEEAADRMKAVPAYAPEFTLHDDRHLLRTTELMGLILGDEMAKLNEIELALLILSAFFHDQGMVLSEDELKALEEDEDFRLFRDNWRVEHPNYDETARQMNAPHISEERKEQLAKKIAELESALLVDHIRETHGHRSAEFIRSKYGHDKRMEVQHVNLSPFLANLCESHTLSAAALVHERGFRYDEQIGTFTLNMPFLAVILRLADILDFDRDRTPEVLLRSIHFTSPVSILEWEKHRSVRGWRISPDLIQFAIKCEHPVYEATARRYMDWVDRELSDAREVCRMQPQNVSACQLNLPAVVDRSRIEPLDDAYRFHDLQFSLSRDEVVRLLMTDKLYGGEHLCIRELLQNSLDALRYRSALFFEAKVGWDEATVKLRHYVDGDGYEIVECTDNGCGMDEEIIQNHFVRIGRSFYRSPVFERERNRLRRSGNDFDPCSQFGIGFMSCFMLGDRITITTRRDCGQGRGWGPPLIIQINGLSGLLVVRDGPPHQPVGTTVSIVSRQKPSFIDTWTDKVQLCRVLKGYALATEFPVVGRCEVPEIEESVTIPPSYEKDATLIEQAEVRNRICIEQDLSEVSPSLRGFVRECFLADDDGLPCLANSEAEWRGEMVSTRKEWGLYLLPAKTECSKDDDYGMGFVPVCTDGILIAGAPGRASFRKDTRLRLGESTSRISSFSPALIDARGELKPEITPGRTPIRPSFIESAPGWDRLRVAFKKGQGLLWEQLSKYLLKGLSPETFWKLSAVHELSVIWIPTQTLWQTLSVSLAKDSESGHWQLVRELGDMSMHHDSEWTFVLRDQNGYNVGPDASLSAWENEGEERPSLGWNMNWIVLLMSSLDVLGDKATLSPKPPSSGRIPLAPYAKSNGIGVSMFLLDYVGNASDALAVQTPYPTANRNHVLSKLYHDSFPTSTPTLIASFAESFVHCISESVSTKDRTPSLDEPGYWQKRVGHLFFSVPWDQYDKSLRPPYRLWTADRGWFCFEEEDFARWRDSPARIG
ncbi:MAG: ATP-binding protein [Deltaproteobacteria bacterium]|nr:ATP-binding protein [Deltaproteobacteria bacterium]